MTRSVAGGVSTIEKLNIDILSGKNDEWTKVEDKTVATKKWGRGEEGRIGAVPPNRGCASAQWWHANEYNTRGWLKCQNVTSLH